MDSSLLVAINPQFGARMWELLDGPELDIRLILLAKFDEYSSPRLVLSSPAFDAPSGNFHYIKFGRILREVGGEFDPPSLLLMKTHDPFVEALRAEYGSVSKKHGLHLVDRALGDRFLEEGYLFRLVSA